MPTHCQIRNSDSGQYCAKVETWLSSSHPFRIGPTRRSPRRKMGRSCRLPATYCLGVMSPCGSCQKVTAVGRLYDASLAAARLATALYSPWAAPAASPPTL